METKTRFTVDLDHCRRAADELYDIFRAQERVFVARWRLEGRLRVVVKIARALGMMLSLLGLILVCTLRFFDTRSWSTQPALWYIPLFLAFIVVMVFQPQLAARVREWSQRRSDNQARRLADKRLRAARRLAPYEADYDLKGDLLIYTRCKDGEWRLAWFRALGKYRARGLAVQADSITAVFRRPSSLVPSILILQSDRDWTGQVLREAGVTVITQPRTESATAQPEPVERRLI